MIRPSKSLKRVFVYRLPVDFRKQVNGLSALVHYDLNHNPMGGDLYVFFNRSADKIRVLYWETNGYVLYGKYLEQDRFIIPTAQDNHVIITGEQLNWLIDGIDLNVMKPHQPVTYEFSV
jgi:transposase